MNSITHFVFLKYIIENDLKKSNKNNLNQNSFKIENKKLKKNKNSVDNFLKFQWSWTL